MYYLVGRRLPAESLIWEWASLAAPVLEGGEWRPKIKFQFSSVQFSSAGHDQGTQGHPASGALLWWVSADVDSCGSNESSRPRKVFLDSTEPSIERRKGASDFDLLGNRLEITSLVRPDFDWIKDISYYPLSTAL